MASRREHWEKVYGSRGAEEQSWFQPRPETSLQLIEQTGRPLSARIIDVGGGSARLVDVLLERGYRNLTVLDISASAIEEAKQRLGSAAEDVQWIEADITSGSPLGSFDIWHDRAVFHFLTEPEERAAYLQALRRSLVAGGRAIIATFAEDGPAQCSGLPVVRYSPDALSAELGRNLALIEVRREVHRTPAGREQSFVYSLFRHTPSS
jgi:SAM-dependent methyltransferase